MEFLFPLVGGFLDIFFSVVIIILIFKIMKIYGGKFGYGLKFICAGVLLMIFYSAMIHLFREFIATDLRSLLRIGAHSCFHILLVIGFYILWKASQIEKT